MMGLLSKETSSFFSFKTDSCWFEGWRHEEKRYMFFILHLSGPAFPPIFPEHRFVSSAPHSHADGACDGPQQIPLRMRHSQL